MANSLTTNPIIIDTTVGAAVARVLDIQAIVWGSNADHALAASAELKITNTAGAVLLQVDQVTAEKEMVIPFPKGFQTNGIIVTVLGGGEVFIYLCAHSN